MKKTVLIIIIIALFFGGGLTFAEKISGVNVPDTMRAGGKTLDLNGGGMRMKVIIKVYVGGLYLPFSTSDAAKVIESDEPMAIWLQFVRDVDKKSIIDAWNTGFKNAAADGYSTSQSTINSFNGVFSSDVKKNGVYEVVYVPGNGTTVSIDGAEKASIPGLDFKKAVFAIWLGSKPADENLKKGMLGKH
jgi:hypothetical protein